MKPELSDDILALLKQRPDDAELHQRLGSAYLKQRQLGEALDAYARAFRLAPNDAFICLYLGNLLQLTDPSGARACFERAAALLPNEAVVHWFRGDLSRSQGR